MATYAVRVREIHEETFLVDANSFEEVTAKTEEFNTNIGFDLEEISEMTIDESPYSNADGTATDYQLRNCERLEDL